MTPVREFEGTSREIVEYLKEEPEGIRYRVTPITPRRHVLTEEERAAAVDRLLSHAVELGYPLDLDNERIDADLAREYGDSHEPSEVARK